MGKISIDKSDNGKIINAKVGDEVEIKLPHNPSVDHYWTIGSGNSESEGSGPVLKFDVAVVDVLKDNTLNPIGYTTFKMVATTPGKSTESYLLKASEEPEDAAHDEFQIIIVVKK